MRPPLAAPRSSRPNDVPAVLIEFEVLAAAPDDEARAAVERVASLGPVILLVSGTDLPATDRYLADPRISVTPAMWLPAGGGRAPGSSRGVDQAAAARLAQIQADHDAAWLIATEPTLPTARTCHRLRVICVGPAPDSQDPTRPDHRAHSLLDAARFIETSEAFA